MSDLRRGDPRKRCDGLYRLYDPDLNKDRKRPVEICAKSGGCPSIWWCLRAAIETSDRSTVRAATTPRQRAALLRAIREEKEGTRPASQPSSVELRKRLVEHVGGLLLRYREMV